MSDTPTRIDSAVAPRCAALTPGTLDHAYTCALPTARTRRVHGVWSVAVTALRRATYTALVLGLGDDAQKLAAFADQIEAEGALAVGAAGRVRA